MAASHKVYTRWWREKDEKLANEVVSICDALETDYEGRRTRHLESLKLYEGRDLRGLYAAAYAAASAPSEFASTIVYPLHQSLVETAQAKIAGRQKPRPMFLTSGGDWKAQRRAKKLDKFVEAVLHQPQGRYLNGWEVALDVYLDSLIWGIGCIKVHADPEEERIVLERVFPFELFCDMQEARGGYPLNLFQVSPCDRDKAIEQFAPGYNPEKEGDDSEDAKKGRAIETAQCIDDDDVIYGGTRRVAQQIRLREAWRLPLTAKKPGKHAVAISGTALVEEDWTRPDFPFVFLRWTNDRIGFWGRGMVEESESQIEEINRAAQRIQTRMKLAASKRTYVEEGSVADEDMESNEDEVIVKVAKGAGFMPVESPPTPFSPMELDYLGFQFLKLYDTSGVSHATATAKNEPGVTSGVAIQNLNDMQTERFAPKSRGFEGAFVGLGRQIVWCAEELGSVTVRLPALTMLRDFDFSDAKLEEGSYHVIVAPVSSLPNDPAGRIDLAERMFNTGLVGADTYKRLAQMPDVEFELQRENAEHNYLEDVIDRFLDAEEGDKRAYEAPEGFIMNKVGAILQFGQAYFDAKLKKAPEFNLELIRRYIKALDKLITRAAEEAARQQAAAMAPTQPAGAPPSETPFPPGGGAPPTEAPPPGATVN